MGTGRRQVIWSAQAAAALDEAVAYVSKDSPSAGIDLLETVLGAAASLAELAERGRAVPEIGMAATRELFVFRYRLMYEVEAQEVHIIAFVHGARDFTKWQASKPEGQE